MNKLAFKVVSILVSVLGRMIAGRIFKQLWKLAAREDEAPRATDVRRENREVLVAAALQGAIFALVQAALDRGLAEATRKLTGSWPGRVSNRTSREKRTRGRRADNVSPAQEPQVRRCHGFEGPASPSLKKLGAPPDVSSVMIGDSMWDVEAAKKAGMPTMAVRSGGFGDDELQKAGAIAIYDTPGDLAKALGDTPLA